jgi:hypothetical protein
VQFDSVRAVDDRAHVHAGADLAAVGLDVARVGGSDRGEVDDPRLGRVQRGQAGRLGLDLAQLGRAEAAQPRDAVRRRPALELVEPGQVLLAHRDHDLPARLGRDAVGVAVRVQRVRPLAAEPRLQRAGRVVDALVDDAAVVGGLVRAEPRLALEHEHPPPAQRELARRRQPHDAATDDRDVRARVHRWSPPAGGRIAGGCPVVSWRCPVTACMLVACAGSPGAVRRGRAPSESVLSSEAAT